MNFAPNWTLCDELERFYIQIFFQIKNWIVGFFNEYTNFLRLYLAIDETLCVNHHSPPICIATLYTEKVFVFQVLKNTWVVNDNTRWTIAFRQYFNKRFIFSHFICYCPFLYVNLAVCWKLVWINFKGLQYVTNSTQISQIVHLLNNKKSLFFEWVFQIYSISIDKYGKRWVYNRCDRTLVTDWWCKSCQFLLYQVSCDNANRILWPWKPSNTVQAQGLFSNTQGDFVQGLWQMHSRMFQRVQLQMPSLKNLF